jgi:hypothetical protein
LSKRVMAQIRSPVRVRTMRPTPWRMPIGVRRAWADRRRRARRAAAVAADPHDIARVHCSAYCLWRSRAAPARCPDAAGTGSSVHVQRDRARHTSASRRSTSSAYVRCTASGANDQFSTIEAARETNLDVYKVLGGGWTAGAVGNGLRQTLESAADGKTSRRRVFQDDRCAQ